MWLENDIEMTHLFLFPFSFFFFFLNMDPKSISGCVSLNGNIYVRKKKGRWHILYYSGDFLIDFRKAVEFTKHLYAAFTSFIPDEFKNLAEGKKKNFTSIIWEFVFRTENELDAFFFFFSKNKFELMLTSLLINKGENKAKEKKEKKIKIFRLQC